jgi:hypothetical protein
MCGKTTTTRFLGVGVGGPHDVDHPVKLVIPAAYVCDSSCLDRYIRRCYKTQEDLPFAA